MNIYLMDEVNHSRHGGFGSISHPARLRIGMSMLQRDEALVVCFEALRYRLHRRGVGTSVLLQRPSMLWWQQVALRWSQSQTT